MGMRSPNRATRILMSALLKSDLTTSELRDLSHTLQRDSDYARRLGRLIDGFLEIMEDRYSAKEFAEPHPVEGPSEPDLRQEAESIVRASRVSKRALVNAIRRIAPEIGSQAKLTRMSTSGLLSAFFEQVSQRRGMMLIEKLLREADLPADAYLRGIFRKR